MSLRRCSKCSQRHSRAGRYCNACHAAYMRAWRKKRVNVSREAILRLLGNKSVQAPERSA